MSVFTARYDLSLTTTDYGSSVKDSNFITKYSFDYESNIKEHCLIYDTVSVNLPISLTH